MQAESKDLRNKNQTKQTEITNKGKYSQAHNFSFVSTQHNCFSILSLNFEKKNNAWK